MPLCLCSLLAAISQFWVSIGQKIQLTGYENANSMRNAKCVDTQNSMEWPYCSFLYCGNGEHERLIDEYYVLKKDAVLSGKRGFIQQLQMKKSGQSSIEKHLLELVFTCNSRISPPWIKSLQGFSWLSIWFFIRASLQLVILSIRACVCVSLCEGQQHHINLSHKFYFTGHSDRNPICMTWPTISCKNIWDWIFCWIRCPQRYEWGRGG